MTLNLPNMHLSNKISTKCANMEIIEWRFIISVILFYILLSFDLWNLIESKLQNCSNVLCDHHIFIHVLIFLFILSIMMMLSHCYVIVLNTYLLMKVVCHVKIS
jgi:hypothetical protein